MSNLDRANRDLSLLHPTVREKVTRVLEQLAAEDLPFQVFEGFRTPQRQQYLYEIGRTRELHRRKVTKSVPWHSYHQYGVAADFVLFENNQWSWSDEGPRAAWWRRLHEIARAQGLEPLSWETPHLQLMGTTTDALRGGNYPAGGDASWAENLEGAIVSWHGTPASPPAPAGQSRPPLPDDSITTDLDLSGTPSPGTGDWHSAFAGGIEWRYDQRGIYLRDHSGGNEPFRSPGEPSTCRAIWRTCSAPIVAASKKYGVSPELIMMTIATEAAFAKRYNFTGPTTFRWEATPLNDDVTPQFRGDYSAGPMQSLATTARWVIRSQGLSYDPFAVAPVYRTRPAPPSVHPLYDLTVNIDIGTAEIKQRWDKTGDDPILVSTAFNAGGVYETSENRWHMRVYGNHLDRAAEWYGDACAVMAEVR